MFDMLVATSTVTDEVEDVAKQANVFVTYVKNSGPTLISFGIKLIIALVILFVGAKLINLVRRIVRRALEKSQVEKGVQTFLDSLVKYALYLVLVMIIIGRFGIESSSIIAVVGSAGIALGLALQGSLANFAGGVIILLLKPFRVGDYIVAAAEGTVTEIQMFYTKILTPDNKQIVVPNGALSNASITNLTAQDKRRLDFTVGIPYTADLKKAKEAIYQTLQSCPQRVSDKDAEVFVDDLADAVMIGARVWVSTADYWEAKCNLSEKLKDTYVENGIKS